MANQHNDTVYNNFEEIDWRTWIPEIRATLLFVVNDGHILLIRKKRGLGAGKINGPGGNIDPGETALHTAIREVQEEVKVTPRGIEKHGELLFQFVDGLSIHCHVFKATGCEGEPQETPEAIPMWTPVGEIPFDEMWEDDSIWLPLVLEGKKFTGRFLFDDDTMLAHEMDLHPGAKWL
jgi:8-oxo-dGTP diphosphatase